eukprot:gene9319-11422_t
MKISILGLCLIALTFIGSSPTVFGFKTICGETNCGDGQICVCRGPISSCVTLSDCSYLALVQIPQNTWVESGCEYTQYRVHLVNYGIERINNVLLGTDCSLQVHDHQIWNITITPRGDLTLPPYGVGINGGSTHSFGYIVRGRTSPNFFVK